MAQTVFEVGDLITSRLHLGVDPDVTTTVTFKVYRPDGTEITGLNASAFVGQVKTLQFYATDDGTASGTALAASGDWLVVWKVTGTGASVSAKVYNVTPLPTQGSNPAWMPFLSDVADYVPWTTIALDIPGGDTFYGTWTGSTYPTDEQAIRIIERVARPISEHWADLPTATFELARSYVALRAAADIARAYPRNPADVTAADAWDKRADLLWLQLKQIADDSTTNPIAAGQKPVFAFPGPVAWGDSYL